MTGPRRWDPNTPAREKTAFGNFELHKTHLITGVKKVPLIGLPDFADIDPIPAAQRAVAARAVGASFEQECSDVADLLDLLGIRDRIYPIQSLNGAT